MMLDSIKSEPKRREDFCTSIRRQCLDVADRLLYGARRDGLRVFEEAMGDAVELNNIEPIMSVKAANRSLKRALSLIDGRACHGARRVDDIDHIPGK